MERLRQFQPASRKRFARVFDDPEDFSDETPGVAILLSALFRGLGLGRGFLCCGLGLDGGFLCRGLGLDGFGLDGDGF